MNTPETDAAVIASKGQWSFVLKETCQRLEQERDKAREDAINYYAKIGELEHERDEALEKVEQQRKEIVRLNGATNHAGGTPLKIALRERDEAREALEYIAHSGLTARHIEDYAKKFLSNYR